MANLTAYFQADFTNFTKAVQTTETRLKSFEQNASKVDATLARMGNKFSGVKVIQDAIAMEKAIADIGGASKLTAAELIEVGNAAQKAIDKAAALGEGGKITQGLKDLAAQGKAASESLAGTGGTGGGGIAGSLGSITSMLSPLGPMIAATFSIGAVVGFAKEIGSMAGQFVDLSDQTGIAIEDLEALDYVASGAGLTIQDITGAVGQMSNRLASGDQSAAAATHKLGLSMQSLLSQKPDQAFLAISEAIAKIENPMERTALAMDLFGKSGAQMTRIMTGNLESLIDQAKETSAVLDEELVRRADAFDDAWGQAVKRVKGYLAGLVLGPSTDNIKKFLDENREAFTAGTLSGSMQGQYVLFLEQLNEMERAAQLETLGSKAPGGAPFGKTKALGAAPMTPEEAAALAGVLPPEVLEKRKKQESELADLERQRQKRIRDQFGQKPPTAEELERALFGYTSAERDKFTADYKAWQEAQFRDLERLRASGPGYVPGGDTSRGGFDSIFDQPPAMALGGVGSHLTEAALRGYKDLGEKSAGGFSSAFSKTIGATLGPSILAAIQGGGNIGKTIAGAIGSSFTSNLFTAEGLGGAVTKGISSKIGPMLGGAIGSLLPGIGALAGPAIDLAVKGIGKLFGADSKETNRTRDQWLAQFGGGDAFRKLAAEAGVADAELRKVFSTKKVADFEAAAKRVADQIGQFNDEQAADAARLEAAYEKYGIAWEEIGIKAQQSQLNEIAKNLIEDWRVLVESGLDLNFVNEKMSESINEFLRKAIQTGAEVPAAMRPILEKMIEQGLLTDEAGNKITDLEETGVHFAETMTQGFDRVVEKLDELIKKLFEANDALANTHVPEGPGEPAPPTLPGFATGTGGKYLDFKTGTPVMLHGRERVMTEGEAEGTGGAAAILASIFALQSTMVRAIRENALGVRDQTLLALGRS